MSFSESYQAIALQSEFDVDGSAPDERLAKSIRTPASFGYLITLVFVGGFAVWGSIAPLAGGALAPGVISPDTNRKTVQHLEGGIIRELRVREGDPVEQGEPLVVLETVQSRASVDMLKAQALVLEAKSARLEAERAGADSIEFPDSLYAGGALHHIGESQKQIFEARRAMHTARKSVLTQRVEQLNEQIKGSEAQIDSTTKQLAFVKDEILGKDELLRKGLLPKPEALRLKRTEAEIAGRRAEYVADVAKTKQQIGEAQFELLSMDADRMDQISAEADRSRNELAEVRERLRASEDVLARTTITAPVDGTVLNLRFSTVGGVVQKGEPILDIVPKEDKLVIEAHVALHDIDIVHPGLIARVNFPAYSRRTAPRFEGVVSRVSADRFADPRTGQYYYLARVEVDKEHLKLRAPKIALVAGMAAEVMIVTQQRTLMEYLFKPILDLMRRGLREA